MPQPHFILIGETKCGTTSLYNYLISHPQIKETLGNGEGYDASYASKELRFFDKFYDRGWDWYFSRFPELEDGEITGEATPMYFYRTQVARRIKEHLPDIKFLVLLRNPVDRLYSNYQHNYKWVPGYAERYPSLESYFYKAADPDYYQIEKSIYYYSFCRWYDHFDPSQFCVIRSEDMYAQPEMAYFLATDFLDLPRVPLLKYQHFRANQYEGLSKNFRADLEDFYRPYNQQLEELLNRKMNWF